MTDNDIIKALEYLGHCDRPKPKKEILIGALSLINRQKAKNERFTEAFKQVEWERDTFSADLKDANAKIERMKTTALERHRHIHYLKGEIEELRKTRYLNVRAEAIKEFAERLKSNFTHSGKSIKYGDFTWDDVTSYEIDNLLKELVGDTNEV